MDTTNLAQTDREPNTGDQSQEIEVLQQRVQELNQQLEVAERRSDDLTGQLLVKEQALKWIYSSRVYRLSQRFCRVLDFVLGPIYRLRDDKPPVPVSAEPTGSPDPAASLEPELPPAQSYDVIRLPVIDWEFRFQRPQQMVQQFARDGHRVFYLRTTFHQEGRFARCTRLIRNVFGVTLPGSLRLSPYRNEIDAETLNSFMASLQHLRTKERIHEAVCIVDLPFWAPLAEELRNRWGWRIVYDCMDEHAGFSTNTSSMIENEDKLLRESDLVITTAMTLTAKARGLNHSVQCIPNAGEHEHFATASSPEPREHGGKPVIGYYGAISDWFDLEMVTRAATARPDWRFVLIGDVTDVNIGPLARLPNVEMRGEIPYADLPGHLAEFDVACIPFLDNELTRATNPVKFFEYVSAGKPVVAVDLNELQPFRDYYYSVGPQRDLISAAERALAENSRERIAARIALGAKNTWKNRHQDLRGAIDALFGKVSIIVVSYQNPVYLQQCIESILHQTLYPNYEILVVDNASDEEVCEYLERVASAEPRVRLIMNADNRGFAPANNQGIEASQSAEYLVLLNNDTIVPPGWLFGLVRYLKNPTIGMVGPVTSFAGNEARITVDYQAPEGIEEFAGTYTAAHADQHFDIDVLAMFCVGMRRDLVDEIGMLDERFIRGMFEDDDYALRIQQAGYRTVCAEDVFVHHWGEGSFGKLERPEYRALFEANKQRFEAKWQRQWIAHQARSWHQDTPPKDRVRPFRVDLCGGGCGTSTRGLIPTPKGSADCGAVATDNN